MTYTHEIIGEIVRRLKGHYPPTAVRSILEALESTAEQMALRANDARYRWLREQNWTLKTFVVVHPKDAHLGSQTYTHELLDEAIDKARGE